MRKRKPHTTIDRHIGRRIRERRTLLGMSQRELAQLLGVEPPMLSRYEIADTTVTASRLYEIARILRSSPEYFFEGFDDHHSMEFSARQRLLLSFMRIVSQIDSEAHREVLCHLVRGLAGRE